MNIFLLNYSPKEAAQGHCDQHIHKMILESAQMLSTVLHTVKPGNYPTVYTPTHQNHPCTQFLIANPEACQWLYAMACYLQTEREISGSKGVHDSLWTIHRVMSILHLDATIEDDTLTEWAAARAQEWPQAMPDYCKHPGSPVQAYRRYYRVKSLGWPEPMTWKNREVPNWFY